MLTITNFSIEVPLAATSDESTINPTLVVGATNRLPSQRLQHPFSADVAETALDLSERFSGGPENAAALEELPVALGGPLYCTGRGKRAPGASLV